MNQRVFSTIVEMLSYYEKIYPTLPPRDHRGQYLYSGMKDTFKDIWFRGANGLSVFRYFEDRDLFYSHLPEEKYNSFGVESKFLGRFHFPNAGARADFLRNLIEKYKDEYQ